MTDARRDQQDEASGDSGHIRPDDFFAEAGSTRHARAGSGAGADSPREARGGERSPDFDPAEARTPVLRNFLVATATVPFVFLMVLIASMFVIGGGERAEAPILATQSVKVSVAPAASGEGRSVVVEGPAETSIAVSPIAAAAPLIVATDAEDVAIRLPVEGPVRSVGLDGDRLALLVDGPEGQVVVVYDVLRRSALAVFPFAVAAAPDAPAPPTQNKAATAEIGAPQAQIADEGEIESIGMELSAIAPSLKPAPAGAPESADAGLTAPAPELDSL